MIKDKVYMTRTSKRLDEIRNVKRFEVINSLQEVLDLGMNLGRWEMMLNNIAFGRVAQAVTAVRRCYSVMFIEMAELYCRNIETWNEPEPASFLEKYGEKDELALFIRASAPKRPYDREHYGVRDRVCDALKTCYSDEDHDKKPKHIYLTAEMVTAWAEEEDLTDEYIQKMKDGGQLFAVPTTFDAPEFKVE